MRQVNERMKFVYDFFLFLNDLYKDIGEELDEEISFTYVAHFSVKHYSLSRKTIENN